MAVVSNAARSPRAFDLSAVMDFAAGSHLRAVAFLIAFGLLAYLPGVFQIPPVDRDEARFAQATRQMIDTGDYVDIRFQEESRYKKPVGIYWLQAGVVKLAEAASIPRARMRIGFYRVPSLIGAMGAVLLTYWTSLAFVSRRAAVLAATMLAASILIGVEARLAKTDAVLLLCCVAAMGALGRAYLGAAAGRHKPASPWLIPMVFWTAIAAGVLVKGPLILMFVALTVAALAAVDRSAMWLWRLKPGVGIAWFIVLVLPWFIAILARSGWNFFSESVGHDLLEKVGRAQESHGAPPGTYFVLFWLTFFPGSILAGLATPAIWNVRREKGAKFLLSWTLPSWVVFEAVATKLPHYVLPLYPAIAILIAGVVDHHGLSRAPWLQRGTVWWFLIAAVLAAAMIACYVTFGKEPGFLAWPFAAVGVIFALRAWWLYGVDGAEHALMRAAAASILLMIGMFAATIPRLPALFPSTQVARYVRAANCGVPQVAAAGYEEPSLIFLTGGSVRSTDGSGAADFLNPGGCRFALVEGRQERAFVDRGEAIGLRYARGPRIEGINISTGRRVSLAIFRAERAP